MSNLALSPRTDLTLEDARRKLAGWHFGQESLTPVAREILHVAEALLWRSDARTKELEDLRIALDRSRSDWQFVLDEILTMKDVRALAVASLDMTGKVGDSGE